MSKIISPKYLIKSKRYKNSKIINKTLQLTESKRTEKKFNIMKLLSGKEIYKINDYINYSSNYFYRKSCNVTILPNLKKKKKWKILKYLTIILLINLSIYFYRFKLMYLDYSKISETNQSITYEISKKYVKILLIELLNDYEVTNWIIHMLKHTLNDQQFADFLCQTINKLLYELILTDEIESNLSNIIFKVLLSDKTRQSITALVSSILEDPKIERTLSVLFEKLFQNEDVKVEVSEALKEILQDVLRDSQFKDSIYLFIRDILFSKDLYKKIVVKLLNDIIIGKEDNESLKGKEIVVEYENLDLKRIVLNKLVEEWNKRLLPNENEDEDEDEDKSKFNLKSIKTDLVELLQKANNPNYNYGHTDGRHVFKRYVYENGRLKRKKINDIYDLKNVLGYINKKYNEENNKQDIRSLLDELKRRNFFYITSLNIVRKDRSKDSVSYKYNEVMSEYLSNLKRAMSKNKINGINENEWQCLYSLLYFKRIMSYKCYLTNESFYMRKHHLI